MERDQATKFINDLLRLMVSKKASDLFITVGFPPAIKLDGRMTPVSQQPLSPPRGCCASRRGRRRARPTTV